MLQNVLQQVEKSQNPSILHQFLKSSKNLVHVTFFLVQVEIALYMHQCMHCPTSFGCCSFFMLVLLNILTHFQRNRSKFEGMPTQKEKKKKRFLVRLFQNLKNNRIGTIIFLIGACYDDSKLNPCNLESLSFKSK